MSMKRYTINPVARPSFKAVDHAAAQALIKDKTEQLELAKAEAEAALGSYVDAIKALGDAQIAAGRVADREQALALIDALVIKHELYSELNNRYFPSIVATFGDRDRDRDRDLDYAMVSDLADKHGIDIEEFGNDLLCFANEARKL